MGLGAGQLEGGQDRQHFRHAVDGRQRRRLKFRFVADHADDRAIRAATEVGVESQMPHAIDDVCDLFFGGAGFENDDHGGLATYIKE